MRFYFLLAGFLLSIFFISCKNKGIADEVESAGNNSSNGDSTEFFYPITQYLEKQIAYVDSTPLAIEKQTFVNNRRVDSVIIDRQAFGQIAKDFLYPDLNSTQFRHAYKESKFHDLTINTLTFSYNAINSDQELQQKDVLLDPETQQVKNVMFRKIEHHGDTTITVNGLWKHNMNFQLNYMIESKSGPMQTKQIKVIWDRPIPANSE